MNTEKLVKRFYLNLGHTLSTIEIYLKFWNLFTDWLEKQPVRITYRTARSADVQAFQTYLYKDQGKEIKNVNNIIGSIRSVYRALIANNIVRVNPALGLIMKGAIKKVKPLAIPYETLEGIYANYPATKATEVREKVILGLIIYQGLSSADLIKLRVKDIDMKDGWVIVKRRKRSNERILKLDFKQSKPLSKYIDKVRPKLIKQKNNPTDALLQCTEQSTNVHNIFADLKEKLRKIDPEIENLGHIRSSVIQHWCEINPNDLLQVQYRAGHRYVSSTESYLNGDVQDLSDKLNRFFPLNF